MATRNAVEHLWALRLSDTPIVVGDSQELRDLHPGARSGPVLSLPSGWEPCWTYSEVPARATVTEP